MTMNSKCPLCDREMNGVNEDEHHLMPKTFKGVDKERLHKICHRKLHATFTEREMKNYYHTWDHLKENEDIQKFIKWVSKKEPDFYSGSKETQGRKGKRRK